MSKLMDMAAAIEQAAIATLEAEGVQGEGPRPLTVCAADYLATEPPAHDAAVVGLADQGDKLCIVGKSKSYKTWLMLQLGACLSARRGFIGFEVRKARKVLFVNPEVRPHWMHRRIRFFAESSGIDDLSNLHFFHTRGTGAGFGEIAQAGREMGAEAYLIDSVYKFMPEDENANDAWKRIGAELDILAESTGALVVFCHHDGKGFAGERSVVDRGSGSGVMGRDYDSCIALAPHRDDQEAIVAEFVTRNYSTPETRVLKWDGYFTQADDLALSIETKGSRANRITKGMSLADMADFAADIVRTKGRVKRGVLLADMESLGGMNKRRDALHLLLDRDEFTEEVGKGYPAQRFIVQSSRSSQPVSREVSEDSEVY